MLGARPIRSTWLENALFVEVSGRLNRYRPEFELTQWDGASWNQAQPFPVGQTEFAKVTPVKGEHHVNPFTVCQVY